MSSIRVIFFKCKNKLSHTVLLVSSCWNMTSMGKSPVIEITHVFSIYFIKSPHGQMLTLSENIIAYRTTQFNWFSRKFLAVFSIILS